MPKNTIEIIINGLESTDFLALARRLEGYQDIVTDPKDLTRTIPNPESPQEAVSRHYEGLIFQELLQENRQARVEAAIKVADDEIGERIKPKMRLDVDAPAGAVRVG